MCNAPRKDGGIVRSGLDPQPFIPVECSLLLNTLRIVGVR